MMGEHMTFQSEDTYNKVITIISEKLSIPQENILASASFKDLGADSLDLVELIMAFEDAFGVRIPDERAEQIKTVQESIDFLHEARTK